MPKILFFDFKINRLLTDPLFASGGSTVQIYSWIQGLTSLKHRVGIFVDAKKQNKSNEYIDELDMYDHSHGIPKLRWIYYRFPWLFKEIRRYRPDYIYQSCAGFTTAIAALISRILKIPFIYRVANDIDSDERIKKLPPHAYWGYLWGIRSASYIVCQNKYQYDNFRKRFPHTKSGVIYNPFYIQQDKVFSKQKKERKYIAWIGLFQYQKNLMGLFDVANNMPDIKFSIAGHAILTIDTETESVIKKLEKLKNVEFVGYISRENIRKFLSKAIALLNTSHYEGFSNTFLEAFSVGTPVITTKKVDQDHVIESNNLGGVCEEIPDLPETINKFIRLKNIDTIRDNCIKYVATNHDPKKLANEMIDFLGK